jgi:outer membrane protein OmpA-like peptidoglycan-associated protein
MTALGRGEDDPIASNDDEAGRSLNRRVEISCG